MQLEDLGVGEFEEQRALQLRWMGRTKEKKLNMKVEM